MATVPKMPLGNDLPWVQIKATLAGALYTKRYRFNPRMNRWIMDIYDAQGNPILLGIPLLVSANLTGRFRMEELPPGGFFCTDDTNQDTQPTRLSFGKDHSLWYYDPTGVT